MLCRFVLIVLLFVMLTSSAHHPGISSFLRYAKSRVKVPLSGVCNVVLGNEACDADSIISSLCYAHYIQQVDPESICIPAASILRLDLPFRREVKLLLNKVSLDLEDLVLAEELPFDTLLEKNMLSLTLVDHNTLCSGYSKYAGCVKEILDHHCDNGNYASVGNTKRQVAFDASIGKALVGSTCTLVAEKYFESGMSMGADVATLLLGVIALDTINMSEQAGIGTERDRAALQRLREISPCSQDALFELLRGAKLDPVFWDELTVDEVLRIDYKAFQSPLMKSKGLASVGIASALQPLQAFLRKERLRETMQSALQSQGLSMMVVMSFVHQPQPRRELIICTADKDLFDTTVQYLLANAMHDFQCSVLEDESQRLSELLRTNCEANATAEPALYGVVLHQGNSKASRKQVAPELLKFLDYFVVPK